MPNPIKRHKPTVLRSPARTLGDKQRANGRMLALNGATWRKLRAVVMNEQPLCAECAKHGLIVAGNEVDHIDNNPSNNERSNLVNLCHACHSLKTQRYEHFKRTGKWLPLKGCDANGMPLDPRHEWNQQKSPQPDACEPSPTTHEHDRTWIFHEVK